eukprot:4431581-Amphidinium_carterae.1
MEASCKHGPVAGNAEVASEIVWTSPGKIRKVDEFAMEDAASTEVEFAVKGTALTEVEVTSTEVEVTMSL